jgi:hypothetical protein
MMSWLTVIIWKFCLKPTKAAERVVEIAQQQEQRTDKIALAGRGPRNPGTASEPY